MVILKSEKNFNSLNSTSEYRHHNIMYSMKMAINLLKIFKD